MYAHPSVAIRPYLAKYEPSNDGNGLPKRISGHAINLNGFATEILEDIWSVIGHEFGYDVREHSIALREQQSEHSLAAAPPFFPPRGSFPPLIFPIAKSTGGSTL